MKKYRLKQWYPSLHKDWAIGDVVVPWKELEDYYHVPNKSTTIYKEEVENNPDFWEEVKHPLFITEDGVKFTFISQKFCVVNKENFRKEMCPVLSDDVVENWLVFYHESNADEYIWRNKRVFSYEDVVEWYGYGFKLGREGIYETLERLAKERNEK